MLQVDLDTGFTDLGEIAHSTSVRRSMRIGEVLYAFSSDMITAHTMGETMVEVASLTLSESDMPVHQAELVLAPAAIEQASSMIALEEESVPSGPALLTLAAADRLASADGLELANVLEINWSGPETLFDRPADEGLGLAYDGASLSSVAQQTPTTGLLADPLDDPLDDLASGGVDLLQLL